MMDVACYPETAARFAPTSSMHQNPLDFKSEYDPIAGLYEKMWRNWYLPEAMPALENLFLSRLHPGTRVLDLCCGAGHVSGELIRRGFEVCGVDISSELVAKAAALNPGAEWLVQDVRYLTLPRPCQAALSTFDSLNHILESDGLRSTFERVYEALEPGSPFVFDMNLEEAYHQDLSRWTVQMKDDHVGLVRGSFDSPSHMANTEVIWFMPSEVKGLWERRRSVVRQRCYERTEVLRLLAEAGFADAKMITARDAGMIGELGTGRVFFVSRTSG